MHLEEHDNIFRSAYEEFEQEPSGDAWQKMDARLNSKAIASYKQRIMVWRGVAVLFLLLLVGFIFFDHSSTMKGAQRQIVTANPKQFKREEKNSNRLEKRPSTENTSETLTTISRDLTGTKVSSFANPSPEFSLQEISSIWNQSPSSSIVLARSVPQANHFYPSFAGIPTPQVLSKPTTTIQKSAGRSSRWSLTGFVAYERANYRLDNDLPPSEEKFLIQQREDHEASFSGGILANLQLRDHWSIQTGLLYSNTSINIKPEMMYASHDDQGNVAFKYVTSSGYAYLKSGFRPIPVVGDSLLTSVAQHNLQTLSVPFTLRYAITDKRLALQSGLGVGMNFFTSTKVVTEIEDASHRQSVIINKLDGTRPFYLSLIVDANIQYSLNNSWSVNLMPSFKYALTSITKDHVVQTFPYSFGIGVGGTFKF